MSDLFGTPDNVTQPLADRMRPTVLEGYLGQEHILGVDKPLRKAIEGGHLHSMIFWGPPGTGKTTLARLLANYANLHFLTLSAVLSGVKDIRQAVDQAKAIQQQTGQGSLLFIDEVHRFNKSQQDAFLPHVEDGTVIFVGATTENPSFELNNALLSRARVYVLKSLTVEQLEGLIRSTLEDKEKGLADLELVLSDEQIHQIATAADGDARRCLNLLEISADLAIDGRIADSDLNEVLSGQVRRFDNKGDVFYDQISALHKSVRGSSVDGSLYWFCRMLDGGCDPLYIARRVVRMASEDIGNADPRGLEIALNAWDVQQRLGSPEGELAVAQAICYLAAAPKSNAVYSAYKQATALAKQTGSLEVPMHLRNAPTSLMDDLGYGDGYRYAHDEPEGYAAGEQYLPDEVADARFYEPVDRGLEIKIREKLAHLRALDKQHKG